MTTQNVTITVVDQLSAPKAGIVVSLLTDGGYLVGTAETNGDGEALFPLLTDGTYVVHTPPLDGWVMEDTSVTVAATAVAQEIEVQGTQLSITPNAPPTTCRVFGFVERGLGVEKVQVSITQLPSPNRNQGGTGVSYPNTFSEGATRLYGVNSSGMWEADLEVGRQYRIEILHTDFTRTVRIPAGFTLRNVMDLPQTLLPSEYPSLRPSS